MIPVEKLTEAQLEKEKELLEHDLDTKQLTSESAERLYFIRKALKRIQSLRKQN